MPESYEARERRLDRARAWRKNNPDKVRAAKKRDWAKRGDQYNAKNREWYRKNREEHLAKLRIDRVANPKKYSTAQKAWKEKNPEKVRLIRERHRINNRESLMWSYAKKSARKSGVSFDLDREWFRERLDAGICEMSGLSFDLGQRRGPNTPSVDRIDPKGAYTKKNCRIVLWWVNRALSDLGEEYCLGVFRAIFIKRGEIVVQEPDKIAA